MKEFFYGIETLFVDYIFWPFDMLRTLEFDSWWGANIVSWLFIATAFVAFIYWMRKLSEFNASDEEDRSSTAHTFLG